MTRKSASKPARHKPRGSFADLESLLEQLAHPPVMELGKPLPNQKYLPKRKPGLTPAQVNRFLLDRPDKTNSHENHSSGASPV